MSTFTIDGLNFVVSAAAIDRLRVAGLPLDEALAQPDPAQALADAIWGPNFRAIVEDIVAGQVPADWPRRKLLLGIFCNRERIHAAITEAVVEWWVERSPDPDK